VSTRFTGLNFSQLLSSGGAPPAPAVGSSGPLSSSWNGQGQAPGPLPLQGDGHDGGAGEKEHPPFDVESIRLLTGEQICANLPDVTVQVSGALGTGQGSAADGAGPGDGWCGGKRFGWW
jgi:hypothetical protein